MGFQIGEDLFAGDAERVANYRGGETLGQHAGDLLRGVRRQAAGKRERPSIGTSAEGCSGTEFVDTCMPEPTESTTRATPFSIRSEWIVSVLEPPRWSRVEGLDASSSDATFPSRANTSPAVPRLPPFAP